MLKTVTVNVPEGTISPTQYAYECVPDRKTLDAIDFGAGTTAGELADELIVLFGSAGLTYKAAREALIERIVEVTR